MWRRGRRWGNVIFILLVILTLGGGVYWFFSSQPAGGLFDKESVTSTSTEEDASYTTLLQYNDPDYHFSLSYPNDLEVQTYDESEGGRTVTFEGQSPGLGFQVFVVPYTDSAITEARFLADDPSGVMLEPQDIVVDGAPAKIFFGHNEAMGDTREVWFIKNGLLYEVTTYKTLDSWISQVMQTWKFI